MLSSKATAESMNAHRTGLIRFAKSQGIPKHQCDDVVQNVFLRVLWMDQQNKAPDPFNRPYLYGAAMNIVREYRRQGARAARVTVLVSPPDHAAPDLGGKLDRRELVSQVKRLAEEDRNIMAFFLRHYRGESYDKICFEFGSSRNAAEQRVSRGQRKLLELFRDYDKTTGDSSYGKTTAMCRMSAYYLDDSPAPLYALASKLSYSRADRQVRCDLTLDHHGRTHCFLVFPSPLPGLPDTTGFYELPESAGDTRIKCTFEADWDFAATGADDSAIVDLSHLLPEVKLILV